MTALCLFQGEDEVSATTATGMLGQADYWNSGTNGWTCARYNRAGYPIDYFWENYGIKYSGGVYIDNDYGNGINALAENYWSGLTYKCCHSIVDDEIAPTTHYAYGHVHD